MSTCQQKKATKTNTPKNPNCMIIIKNVKNAKHQLNDNKKKMSKCQKHHKRKKKAMQKTPSGQKNTHKKITKILTLAQPQP